MSRQRQFVHNSLLLPRIRLCLLPVLLLLVIHQISAVRNDMLSLLRRPGSLDGRQLSKEADSEMIFTKNRQRGDPNLCLEDYEVRGVRPCRESGILGGGSSGAGGSANIIDFDVFVGLRPGTQSPGHVAKGGMSVLYQEYVTASAISEEDDGGTVYNPPEEPEDGAGFSPGFNPGGNDGGGINITPGLPPGDDDDDDGGDDTISPGLPSPDHEGEVDGIGAPVLPTLPEFEDVPFLPSLPEGENEEFLPTIQPINDESESEVGTEDPIGGGIGGNPISNPTMQGDPPSSFDLYYIRTRPFFFPSEDVETSNSILVWKHSLAFAAFPQGTNDTNMSVVVDAMLQEMEASLVRIVGHPLALDTNQNIDVVVGSFTNETNVDSNSTDDSPGDSLDTVSKPDESIIQRDDWDWQLYVGLALVVSSCTFSAIIVIWSHYWHKNQRRQEQWANLTSEDGMNELLGIGWVLKDEELVVFDKSKAGYSDNDSVFRGGFQQREVIVGAEISVTMQDSVSTPPDAGTVETQEFGIVNNLTDS